MLFGGVVIIEYKPTSIGKIPVDWEVKNIAQLTKVNQKSRDPRKMTSDYEFSYIDIESIENESGLIKTTQKILGIDAPSRARRVVRENDVIMSTVRPYLKAFALIPKEYDNQICSTGFAVLSSMNTINPKYLLYSLFSNFVIEQCNRMMMGGQYPALNTLQVKKIKMPVPPLAEQEKIAQILSTTDHAILKTNEIITQSIRLKKGLIQKLLNEGIGHAEFNDTSIGRIPKEWKIYNAEDICIKVTDGTHDTPKPTKRGHMLVTSKNIKNGAITFSNTYLISELDFKEINKRSKVDKNDLLFSMIGTVGLTAIVREEYPIFAIKNVGLFKTKGNKLLSSWLYHYFDSIFAKKYIQGNIKGTTQKYIPLESLRRFPILVPEISEMKKITEFLAKIDLKIELEIKRKTKLQNIKKALMNDLLTGRKRVKMNN